MKTSSLSYDKSPKTLDGEIPLAVIPNVGLDMNTQYVSRTQTDNTSKCFEWQHAIYFTRR